MNTDRVSEVYYEKLYSHNVQQDLRQRIHWMCSKATGSRVLDVGCSQGVLSILLAREGHRVLGLDVDKDALAYAEKDRAEESEESRERLEFRNVSVFDCAFDEGSFDTIYLGEIIEHVVNPERLIELAAAWLASDGRVIVTTPFGVLEDPDHKRTYYLGGFCELVTRHLEAVELAVIGKRICYVGTRRQAGAGHPKALRTSAESLLKLSEQAFEAAEKRYLDEIRQMHERHRASSTERKELEAKLEAIRGELDASRAGREKAARELEEKTRAHQQVASDLQRRIEDLERTRDDLRRALDTQSKALEAATRREEQARQREARALDELGALRSNLAGAEARVQGLERRIEESDRLVDEKNRRVDELSTDAERLRSLAPQLEESRELVDQKERYIQHLKEKLREANLQAQRYYRWGQQHLDSVRYQLGYALLRAARPSRDTLLLPARLAGIFWNGLKGKKAKGELGAVAARLVRLRGAVQATPGQGGEPQPAAAGQDMSASPRVSAGPVDPKRATLDRIPRAQVKWALDLEGWKRPAGPGEVKVCAVMDEFTAACFGPECQLVQPRPDDWESLSAYEHPHLLLVESAWKGNGGAWQYRVARYADPPGTELADMVARYRSEGLPTVFWNKEDPVHFDQFLNAARRFDVILTTDRQRVEAYRKASNGARVDVLAFAAQPRLHNPIGAPRERLARPCFAGSYYANRFQERRAEMEMLLDAAVPFEPDIFDRNHGLTGPGADDFRFPERFQPHIRGRLSYAQTLEAYRRYRVFLNVNSVVDSPTMFSRRVFELLACGTPVVSTPSRGIEELLGQEAVWVVSDAAQAKEAIETLLTDDREWRRRSLRGVRAVFGSHTYRRRFGQILELTGLEVPGDLDPGVLLVAEAKDRHEAARVLDGFGRQSYQNASLLLFCPPEACPDQVPAQRVELVVADGIDGQTLGRALEEKRADLVGRMRPDCLYGRHYLEDLVYARTYSRAAVVGKAQAPDQAYRFHQQVHPAGCIFALDLLDLEGAGDDAGLVPDPATLADAGAATFTADDGQFVAGFEDWHDEQAVDRRLADCEERA